MHIFQNRPRQRTTKTPSPRGHPETAVTTPFSLSFLRMPFGLRKRQPFPRFMDDVPRGLRVFFVYSRLPPASRNKVHPEVALLRAPSTSSPPPPVGTGKTSGPLRRSKLSGLAGALPPRAPSPPQQGQVNIAVDPRTPPWGILQKIRGRLPRERRPLIRSPFHHDINNPGPNTRLDPLSGFNPGMRSTPMLQLLQGSKKDPSLPGSPRETPLSTRRGPLRAVHLDVVGPLPAPKGSAVPDVLTFYQGPRGHTYPTQLPPLPKPFINPGNSARPRTSDRRGPISPGLEAAMSSWLKTPPPKHTIPAPRIFGARSRDVGNPLAPLYFSHLRRSAPGAFPRFATAGPPSASSSGPSGATRLYLPPPPKTVTLHKRPPSPPLPTYGGPFRSSRGTKNHTTGDHGETTVSTTVQACASPGEMPISKWYLGHSGEDLGPCCLFRECQGFHSLGI
ncbi:leucine-rich repeat extensin-like protein 5 [Penaeus monodon]|uniref:leucine-rich repeat extensin-like protein 5 n=1 Tax=Penaeus monodon TaxID=6687 RepID=UPI0018A71F91|nr:leucine-rich repeat extensin-like protein 5 [Penaeus monodon]